MNSKLYFLISVVIILLATSCQRDPAEIVIAEISLDEELNLALREQFQDDGTVDIIAKITTTSEYACEKGKLRTTLVKTNNNEILLNVIGLDFTDTADCQDEDVAKSEITLGDLPIGIEFSLQILLLGELKTAGSITNNPNSIVVDLPENGEQAVTVENQIITKIPAGTAWGFISSDTPIADSTILKFINEMEGNGSPLENPGVFGNFQIDPSGNAHINDFELQGRTLIQKGFAIELGADFENLKDVAQGFCSDDYRIRLWDTFGLTFDCN